MLWIYSSNDTYFGPELSKQVHEAFTGAGGIAEYHLLPPFGGDGSLWFTGCHFDVGAYCQISFWISIKAS